MEVDSCAGRLLLMSEVERGNVLRSPNRTEVESCADSLTVTYSDVRNFETNMFCFRTASSILVRLFATWSVFVCRQNVIATLKLITAKLLKTLI